MNAAEKALGYQQITNLAASTGLTVPAGTRIAIIIPETAAVRWRDDGVAPTATVGMPLAVAGVQTYTAGEISSLRFIQQTAGAVLNVNYYG